jgi:hypothetical protein
MGKEESQEIVHKFPRAFLYLESQRVVITPLQKRLRKLCILHMCLPMSMDIQRRNGDIGSRIR